MKIYRLDKNGHTVLEVDRDSLKAQVDELIKEGMYLVDREGNRYEKVEDIPDTVEELIAGKKIEYNGRRGY